MLEHYVTVKFLQSRTKTSLVSSVYVRLILREIETCRTERPFPSTPTDKVKLLKCLVALTTGSEFSVCCNHFTDEGCISYHGYSICFVMYCALNDSLFSVLDCSVECPAVRWLSVGCSGEGLCPLWNGAVWWQCWLWREPRWVWRDHTGCHDHERVIHGHNLCFY